MDFSKEVLMTENNTDVPVLLTIHQFAEKHKFMTENSIRWLLFRDPPGLEECLVRVSRRIYINEKKFFHFLQNANK
jgi:hypothetical protein